MFLDIYWSSFSHLPASLIQATLQNEQFVLYLNTMFSHNSSYEVGTAQFHPLDITFYKNAVRTPSMLLF